MSAPNCPKCDSEMYDNRPKKASGEFKVTSPDFKCKNKECQHVIWPAKKTKSQNHVSTEESRYENVKEEMQGKGEVRKPDPDWPDVEQPQPEQNGGVTEARRHLMQSANLYCLCMAATENVVIPSAPAVFQTPELFQASTATLFIEGSRAGLVNKMPMVPIK